MKHVNIKRERGRNIVHAAVLQSSVTVQTLAARKYYMQPCARAVQVATPWLRPSSDKRHLSAARACR